VLAALARPRRSDEPGSLRSRFIGGLDQ